MFGRLRGASLENNCELSFHFRKVQIAVKSFSWPPHPFSYFYSMFAKSLLCPWQISTLLWHTFFGSTFAQSFLKHLPHGDFQSIQSNCFLRLKILKVEPIENLCGIHVGYLDPTLHFMESDSLGSPWILHFYNRHSRWYLGVKLKNRWSSGWNLILPCAKERFPRLGPVSLTSPLPWTTCSAFCLQQCLHLLLTVPLSWIPIYPGKFCSWNT